MPSTNTLSSERVPSDDFDFASCKNGRREETQCEALQRAARKQTKRDQWKAASARYYERHPEVKEKKRVKMAEKRAAKKLARRQRDPPTQAECVAYTTVIKLTRTQQLGKFPKEDLDLCPDDSVQRAYLSHDGSNKSFQSEMLEACLGSCWESSAHGSYACKVAVASPLPVASTEDAAAALPSIAEVPTTDAVHPLAMVTPEAAEGSVSCAWSRLAPAYSSEED
ncbi:hypothetical protein K438DRAFT_1768851 [Mycena galopus ATCC 62051]|nr:hypothetical protein K438DRAFT_1768851 [Mycena galopus ATCC 62051]